jgi:hypothetical protein
MGGGGCPTCYLFANVLLASCENNIPGVLKIRGEADQNHPLRS